MATKDERPGLLSKVAQFVRNPTKDWSELDQLSQQSEESSYDKQVLKAMIERKRQNDFVRRREFDQLRKLRKRDPGAMANMARQSYFPTSAPTDIEGRAVTLKKIDEIEAQMSRQWWKNKTDAASIAPDMAVTVPGDKSALLSEAGGAAPSRGGEAGGHSEFSSTIASSAGTPLDAQAAAGAHRKAVADSGFTTSRIFALEVDDVPTDPELEEAAILFANGDSPGAERCLLAALRGAGAPSAGSLAWAAALLDLYRAGGRRAEFDSAVQEFAAHLDGARPVWADYGAFPSTQAGLLPPGVRAEVPLWECPAVLTAFHMEQLREAMATHGLPWHLGWSAVQSLAPDTLPLLDGLFASLCSEPVRVVFTGVDQLLQVLTGMTPSGDRSVDRGWWQVRLNVLRVLQQIDEFELAALDYCVTHELSPPAWEDARCTVERRASEAHAPDTEPGTAPMGLATSEGPGVLSGEILGDASDALAALDLFLVPGQTLVVGCARLLRVDFAAAGSILNWVAQRQSEGRQMQFQDVHRLVAAFFMVIGINEHAKVVPRPI